MRTLDTDVLVVGGGPAGSSAAAWAARAGLDTLIVDAADFPRDKPCGDGLTPRAVAEMQRLGMAGWLRHRPANWGLRASGFGRTWHLPWPGGSMPATGSAAPRTELDAAVLAVARASGARFLPDAKVVEVDAQQRLRGVTAATPEGEVQIRCRRAVIADGARSPVGRLLGRTWHRDTVYGVAARGYADSGRSDDPWISSHLELRSAAGELLSGYGWIFPLGDGKVNIGVGTLATAGRPADVNLRRLIGEYFQARRDEWQLSDQPRLVRSALLPMGGAVSGVAGPNWVLVGDAAGCVNPLNGEGIDYGLETGRLAAAQFGAGAGLAGDLSGPWSQTLTDHYGAAFSVARRLAGLLTHPDFLRRAGPVGMRSRSLMTIALRVMGNLVTEEDTDAVARLWRLGGNRSLVLDDRRPFAA
jgi:geranylgeranyl reductase family protein